MTVSPRPPHRTPTITRISSFRPAQHSLARGWAIALLTLTTGSFALAQHSEKERQQDIQRHEAMAAAHQAAAQCLKSGKDEKACLAELRAACKGLAIGKYCGMKHAH